MKKFSYILISLLIVSATALHAQGQMDALRFSQGDIFGTARAMGMGGAFGALGGDQTGISINPAGIAIYRSSEVVGTFQFMTNSVNVGNDSRNRNSFTMPNIGFVSFFPTRHHAIPFINVGFSYSQTQSFNRNVVAFGSPRSSLLNYIADRSSGLDEFDLQFRDNYNPFHSQPWLSVLAYNSWLINPEGNGHWSPVNTHGEQVLNEIRMRERGFIDNFGFTIGTTIHDVLSLGATLTVSTIMYRLDSEYHEDWRSGGYTLENMLTTDGAGVSGRFGLIFRPVHEFRLGVSYHTPTRFALTETFSAAMIDDMEAYVLDPNYEPGRTDTQIFSNEFDLRTPGRWVFSAAGVLGDFIISADYEITNFTHMKLLPSSNDRWHTQNRFYADNYFIREDFRAASTLRLGLDYRVNPQLSLRAGYVWQQNPNTDTFQRNGNPLIAGSNTIFVVDGDASMFTAGIGYRFNRNFFMDFALMYRTQTSDLYAFPNILFDNGAIAVDATPFTMQNNSFRGVMTMGWRF